MCVYGVALLTLGSVGSSNHGCVEHVGRVGGGAPLAGKWDVLGCQPRKCFEKMFCKSIHLGTFFITGGAGMRLERGSQVSRGP